MSNGCSRGALVLLWLAAACHSEPFEPAFYGATGPLTADTLVRMTYADTNEDGIAFKAWSPSWAADGRGIIFSFAPRPYAPGEKKLGLRCILNHPCHPVAEDVGDQCLAMLAPNGGSAVWNVCESRAGHSNINDIIEAGDVNAAGQLLYIERATQARMQFVPDGPSVSYSDLWLSTPANPVTRRHLCGCSLRDIQWAGPDAFVAIAGFGLTRGVIDADGATFAGIVTPVGVRNYALVNQSAAIIFVGTDSTIRQVELSSGAVSTVATLPGDAVGSVLDIGCHPDVCVVLATSRTGNPRWNLWRVDRATGSTAIVRSIARQLLAAKLSPVTGDVVALDSTAGRTNLYWIPGVIP